MRVITGIAKGRKLRTLEGNDVRPTTDKVKEAIFSSVQFDLDGAAVIDLFAGSGQMGIEALSRGAASAVFTDISRKSIDIINENLSAVGLAASARVINTDGIDFLKSSGQKFDIAILDPPYRCGLIEKALPVLENLMNDGGKIICEHEKELSLPDCYQNIHISRTYNYGKISVTIFIAGNGEE